jgi:hypothetical protein
MHSATLRNNSILFSFYKSCASDVFLTDAAFSINFLWGRMQIVLILILARGKIRAEYGKNW